MDRETTEEIKRHFSVVAEGLRSEIRAVAEGLEGLREEVSAEFRAVREELNEVKGDDSSLVWSARPPAHIAGD